MSKDNEAGKNEQKGFLSEDAIEVITVILLGITALLTAWATYVGSIHSGNQATNFAKSNNLSSDGNSRYNEAAQNLAQDMETWNTIASYETDIIYADSVGDEESIEEKAKKLQWFCSDNLTDDMAEAIGYDVAGFSDGKDDTKEILAWLNDESDIAINSPFNNKEFVDGYYAEALDVLDESQQVLETGQQDNAKSDKFSLVSVIYSVVLFLLGIVGVFKNKNNKVIVLAISVVCLLIAFIFMLTIPLPASGGIFG